MIVNESQLQLQIFAIRRITASSESVLQKSVANMMKSLEDRKVVNRKESIQSLRIYT